MVKTLEAVAEFDRALVFGIGGGGDIVGAYPTAGLIDLLGVDVILGGVAWERAPRDARPGPRSLDELTHIEPIADRVAYVTPETATTDGVHLAEAGVRGTVDIPTVVLDVSAGHQPLAASLNAVCVDLGIDLVIGVDAGGDVLATGSEPGLRSPISDAIGLLTLTEVDVASLVGMVGYGSDGELTHAELAAATSELADQGAVLGAWGITPRIRRTLERLVEAVDTEASRIPLEAALGAFGRTTIRDGARTVTVTPASIVTYYFDPHAVVHRSTVADVIAEADTIENAATRLRERGIHTEFDTEREARDAG